MTVGYVYSWIAAAPVLWLMLSSILSIPASASASILTTTTTSYNNNNKDEMKLMNSKESRKRRLQQQQQQQDNNSNTATASCSVLGIYSFTNGLPASSFDGLSDRKLGVQAYSKLAAQQLAIDHFNTRNNTIIPDLLDKIHPDCTVTFGDNNNNNNNNNNNKGMFFFDGKADERAKFRGIVSHYYSDESIGDEQQVTTTSSSSSSSSSSETPSPQNWCGIMAEEYRPAIVTLVESLGLPYLIFSGGDDFVRPYNQIVQMHLLNYYLSQHIITFLDNVMQIPYIGILNAGDRNQDNIARGLTAAVDSIITINQNNGNHNHNHTIKQARVVNLQSVGNMESYKTGLELIRDYGYRAIVVVALETRSQLEYFAQAARSLGMDTHDYFYILPQISLSLFQYDLTPSQLQFLDGAIFVTSVDKFVLKQDDNNDNDNDNDNNDNNNNDPFLQAWRSVDSQWKQRLDEVSGFHTDSDTYFQDTQPSLGSSIVYDTVMSLGMAVCQMQTDLKNNTENNNNNNNNNNTTTTTAATPEIKTIKQIMTELQFSGASGDVVLDQRGARQPKGMPAGVYNTRLVDGQLKLVLVSYTQSDDSDSDHWTAFNETMAVIFKGGVTEAPSFELVIKDMNYLSNWVRVVGLVLYGLTTLCSVLALVAVVIMRKDQTILRTQPPYSMLLCISCTITTQTILVLSFDEQLVNDEQFLDRNCLAAPWLLFIGLVTTYTVLFCKLWRLDRVMQFRRATKVRAIQTMWPLAIMLFVTIALLIGWTVLDPWHWERNFVSFEPPIQYGQCVSENFLAWAIPLSGVMIISVLLAFSQAWKTKDIPRDLSDTATVFYAIGVQMQAWFVFIPIAVVLDNSSADATYLGRVLWIWILSATPLILVLGPRVVHAIRVRRGRNEEDNNKNKNKRTNRVQISGLVLKQHNGSSTQSRRTPSLQSHVQMKSESPEEDEEQQGQEQEGVMVTTKAEDMREQLDQEKSSRISKSGHDESDSLRRMKSDVTV